MLEKYNIIEDEIGILNKAKVMKQEGGNYEAKLLLIFRHILETIA